MDEQKIPPLSPSEGSEEARTQKLRKKQLGITGKEAEGQEDRRKRKGAAHPNFRHGWSCTPTMSCWQSMIRRCYDPRNDTYKYYGGIGRRVCEKLRRSIVDFVEVAGEKPTDLQIDRTDNNGHYSCGKCPECLREGWIMNLRWSTRKVQCRNRKNSVLLKIGGVLKPIGDWADEMGLPDYKVYNDALSGKIGELVGSKNRDCAK